MIDPAAASRTDSRDLPGRPAPTLPALQGLRLLCAAGIAVTCFWSVLQTLGLLTVPVLGSAIAAAWLGFDVLFIISGFVMARTAVRPTSVDSLIRWWWHRLVRLYPLYGLTTLMLAAWTLTGLADAEPVDGWSVIRSALLLSATEPSFAAPLWGVSVLWLSILLLPIASAVLDRARAWPGVVAALIVVMLALVTVVAATSPQGPPTFGLGAYVRGIGEVLVGVALWTLLIEGTTGWTRSRRTRLGNALGLFSGAAIVIAIAAGAPAGWLIGVCALFTAGCAIGSHNVIALLARVQGSGAAGYSLVCAAAIVAPIAALLAGTPLTALVALLLGAIAVVGVTITLWRLVDQRVAARAHAIGLTPDQVPAGSAPDRRDPEGPLA